MFSSLVLLFQKKVGIVEDKAVLDNYLLQVTTQRISSALFIVCVTTLLSMVFKTFFFHMACLITFV